MSQREIGNFFEYIGEIWRDITAIEFLMRVGIARKDNEIDKFPKPPYIKGQIYQNSPDSFGHYTFEIIVKKFNKRYPSVELPKELVELRNAMVHGIVSRIGDNPYETLVKFKSKKDNQSLEVEFSLDLNIGSLSLKRQQMNELRRKIGILVSDKD